MSDRIVLPTQLAAAAADLEAEEPNNNFQSTIDPPASLSQIHLPKKRASVPAITPFRAISSGSAQSGDTSFVSIVNDCRLPSDDLNSDTAPTANRFSTRLSWRDQATESDIKHKGLPSRSGASLSIRREPSIGHSNKRIAVSRNTSLGSRYDVSNLVKIKHRRQGWVRLLVEYGAYTIFACFVYFVLIGVPLWNGAVFWLYVLVKNKFVFEGGWAIVMVLVILFSFTPLLLPFEDAPPPPEFYIQRNIAPAPTRTSSTCALIIPAYRSAPIIGRTLDNALQIFPPSHIFVVANGNSSNPLDNTGTICASRGVNHIWCPIGSKIIAIFVGCHAAAGFRHVLLMDDDCVLPPDFPVVTSRLRGQTECISYTIGCAEFSPSSNPNPALPSPSAPPTWCQKAQDLEYKLAGLQRYFAGRIGSASFPHGAISLWNKRFLKRTLEHHPGFSISEDWFLGHVCRQLGGRIEMCSAVFVQTATPAAMFFAGDSRWWRRRPEDGSGVATAKSRSGFGEMTLVKQRFSRWNFFVASCLWHNLGYLVGSWKLGWMEVGTKTFVFQEVYETLTYLLSPFILPISLLVKPVFCVAMLAAITGLYLIQAILFNEIHLRRKKQRVNWRVLVGYYIPYKLALHVINVAGCFWCMFRYARYFAQQRLKLTEDHKVIGMVLKLEEQMQMKGMGTGRQGDRVYHEQGQGLGRRLTVTKIRVAGVGDGSASP
ncbi:glycosyltransferase like family 2-domain-containing protein [Aspergillus stella-maris]|uniref:glycosyltransferase like family 2-domain-containing protein n=1 Tax=Aspergillus stella-maris TaxID=1810926 RepID=UPI003CCDC61C